jgi:hypothetical protein
MIGMSVGDDGPVHWAPGVDVEVAGGAVDAIFVYLNHVLNLPYQCEKTVMRIVNSLAIFVPRVVKCHPLL